MTVREMIREGGRRLLAAHCSDSQLDAELLYYHLTGTDRVGLFLRANQEVDQETQEKYFALIAEREKRIPLQHITGVQEFMGLDFEVNKNVLIPRQDTEILVEEAARIIHGENPVTRSRKAWKVLDLCCGSGAIGISIARICSNAKVTCADYSSEALEVAQRNAVSNRAKVKFRHGDLFGAVGRRKYDIIVSNPPYIKSHRIPILQDEVKIHEPMMALDGGEDGLVFYRKIVQQARQHLKKNGVLIFEIGHDQAEEVTQLIQETGHFKKVYVVKDLPGHDRVVYAETLY